MDQTNAEGMTSTGSKRAVLPALTIFSGSFLLFLVQPLMGRTLLPVFGGAASVWLICLAAWQSLLLAGYFYAHCLRAGGRRIRKVHFAFLLFSGAMLFAVTFFRETCLGFITTHSGGMFGVIVGILIFAAFPYLLLASGSTLVQAWLSADSRRSDVYHLFAISNAGSFCGLFCYPFLVEPLVPLGLQWYGFSVMLILYAFLLNRFSGEESGVTEMEIKCTDSQEHPDRRGDEWGWFLLPALTCLLLNAVISHIFIDITPLPLLWVVFVGCFLLSYVCGFSRCGSVFPKLWYVGAFASVCAAIMARKHVGAGSFLINGVSGVCVLIFFGTWVHRKLFEARPEAVRLTRYYLVMTAGGAAGGVLSSVVAPLLFSSVVEYPVALGLSAFLLAALPLSRQVALNKYVVLRRVLLGSWAVLVCATLHLTARKSDSKIIYRSRNFYGVLSVTKTMESFDRGQIIPVHYLWSGQTTHGLQIRREGFQSRPNSYYGESGGGIAVIAHPNYRNAAPLTVGIVGLGSGSMASYGRPSDLYRFYEINPDVIRVAGNPNLFSYLADSKAAIDLIEGDARRMLEIERAAADPLYDVLMIDAYSGDGVPYHLATKEAFELYFSRLKNGGILALHVSNWHVDMLPLCKAAARYCGVEPYGVISLQENAHTTSSIWVFMSRDPPAWRYPGWDKVREINWPLVPDITVPEDDCGSLISLIRWY